MPEVQARTYANPRRLPRRNHYQEGPGFLFVATQGAESFGHDPDAAEDDGHAADGDDHRPELADTVQVMHFAKADHRHSGIPQLRPVGAPRRPRAEHDRDAPRPSRSPTS